MLNFILSSYIITGIMAFIGLSTLYVALHQPATFGNYAKVAVAALLCAPLWGRFMQWVM